jgi:hypothetical protein
MHRDLRLRLLKALVNVPMRFLDKLLSFPLKSSYPQTRAVFNIYGKLDKVYRLDVFQGTFGRRPDRNFARLLRVSAKILARISEDDPYYRNWVGLVLFLSGKAYHSMVNFDPATVKRLFQGDSTRSFDDIPDNLIIQNLEDFKEMALCGHLSNLAQMSIS